MGLDSEAGGVGGGGGECSAQREQRQGGNFTASMEPGGAEPPDSGLRGGPMGSRRDGDCWLPSIAALNCSRGHHFPL